MYRWNIEVTFEELRAHLGFETQRQWSDRAIERTTPALFGMFSIIVLMALEISKTKVIQVMNCAWYKKTDANYSDIIAFVRRYIWRFRNYAESYQVNFVMKQEPYRSANRVFCVTDNGSSHRGQGPIDRFKGWYPNPIQIHTPIHATLLNQVEIFFSYCSEKF